tara:strand:+ start:337 stop:618 length:282 start_codon:yes stop_codon:yes gene_type:complete
MKLSFAEMTKLETLINKAEGTDISVIIELIKAKQRGNAFKAAAAFRVGQMVTFNTRSGSKVVGSIVKVNTKNLKVKSTDGMNWNVTASLCKVA